jgi:hypothetical protein
LPAKGVVAEIRDAVKKRDAFTRVKLERDRERDKRVRGGRKAAERRERDRAARERGNQLNVAGLDIHGHDCGLRGVRPCRRRIDLPVCLRDVL